MHCNVPSHMLGSRHAAPSDPFGFTRSDAESEGRRGRLVGTWSGPRDYQFSYRLGIDPQEMTLPIAKGRVHVYRENGVDTNPPTALANTLWGSLETLKKYDIVMLPCEGAAKARPGQLSYASFGNGTSAHLSGEMLKAAAGVDLIHVPYKGQAPALSDLLGGQVSAMFGNWPEFRAHVRSGKLVALGMATVRRSVYAPSIPTLAEQGVKLESNSWNGLLAPAGTPDAVVQKLNAEVIKALTAPGLVEAFQKGGIASLSGSTGQFAEFIQSEIARYAEVIRRANITAES